MGAQSRAYRRGQTAPMGVVRPGLGRTRTIPGGGADPGQAIPSKTALLLQSNTPLPLEIASHTEGLICTDGFLYKALRSRYEYEVSSSPTPQQDTTDAAVEDVLTLKTAPDTAVVLAHAGKGSMPTNIVVALGDQAAYNLLATAANPTADVELHTTVRMEGAIHNQIITITIRPHYRSILGGKYHQLLTDAETQNKAIAHSNTGISINTDLHPLKYNDEKKHLEGTREQKRAWASLMAAHPIAAAFDDMKDEEVLFPARTYNPR